MPNYTTAQVAEKLGITVRRVRALCEAGRLQATRFGKSWQISQEALDAYEPRGAGRPGKGVDNEADDGTHS